MTGKLWVITEWDYITGSHLKGVATDEEIAKRLMQEFSPHPPQKSEHGKGWYAPTADEVVDDWRWRGPYISAFPVKPNVLIGTKEEEE